MLVRITTLAALLMGGAATLEAQDHSHVSPYLDLMEREIKSLSNDDITSLLEGEGMGYALPAELHGFPGPKHILELADSLALTPAQRADIESIWNEMLGAAMRLGREIVDGERALDQRFQSGSIGAEDVYESTRRLGLLEGELRAVHLSAHLTAKAVLTTHQLHLYQQLRGYASHHDMG
jgi:hypothetical protein